MLFSKHVSVIKLNFHKDGLLNSPLCAKVDVNLLPIVEMQSVHFKCTSRGLLLFLIKHRVYLQIRFMFISDGQLNIVFLHVTSQSFVLQQTQLMELTY